MKEVGNGNRGFGGKEREGQRRNNITGGRLYAWQERPVGREVA